MKALIRKIPAKLRARKKLVLITSAAVTALALAGGGTLFALNRSNSEDILYAALTQEMAMPPGGQYGLEQSFETADVHATAESYINTGGAYNADISLKCDASSINGEVTASFTFRQIKADTWLRYDKVTFTGGEDEDINKQLNDFYKSSLAGKWILMDEKDDQYLGYKESGVLFGVLGAYSKKFDENQITGKLRESGVITILDVKDIRDEGKPALEYDVLLRKQSYERFMSSVAPNYQYKASVLDNYFEDETTEVTVVVDKATHKGLYAVYSVPNMCTDFISAMDPDAVEAMPEHVTIKNSSKSSGTANKLAKPTDFMTQDEFYQLISAE